MELLLLLLLPGLQPQPQPEPGLRGAANGDTEPASAGEPPRVSRRRAPVRYPAS